jgi:hypothetical protein
VAAGLLTNTRRGTKEVPLHLRRHLSLALLAPIYPRSFPLGILKVKQGVNVRVWCQGW